jgi:alpha-ketoglutarate-dependent taurine dioxygenase
MAHVTHETVRPVMSAPSWGGPVVVRPSDGAGLEAWVAGHHDWIDAALLEHGAVLLRGFDIDTPERFSGVATLLTDKLLDYVYRSTPRTTVADRVYTATEYPPDATIPMHNENAFQRDWPMRLVFGCMQPAARGGETPLARSVDVTRRIDPEVRRAFAARKVMYVRNYGHGIDLPWETTFQTESPAEVEAFCAREGIEWEWLPEGRLRTRQTCQALARHPLTGDEVWFNQAHLFHVSSLGEEGQAAMLDTFGENDLPRHAYYGDGGAIDEATLDHIRAAYRAETCTFPWERGDVLLLDNMLVAHSRNPFEGPRKILVGMGTPFSSMPAR